MTDAICQDISAVGRHEWATVGGEIHPQKPRFPHQAGSILRSRMHIRYFSHPIFLDDVVIAQRGKCFFCKFYMVYTEKEKGKYIFARDRTKERVARGLVDCSNQSTAIHFQKASLHHTAHIPCPCVPPAGARPYMPAAAPLLKSQPPKERLCVIKERVAPDLLDHLQNQSNGICYSPQVVFPSQEG